MELLSEVFLNIDDETLIEFRSINEDTEAILNDEYLIEQRVEYRGYTKKAWRDLIGDYPDLRLSCLHHIDYTVIGDQLDKENYLNIGLVLEEILILLYIDHPQARYNCFQILTTYSSRRSMWLVPEFDQQTGAIQQWTPLMIALVGPGITPDQWILNPVLVKSIIAVLKFVRSRVTSTHELQEVYQYVAQLWDQLGYLGDYTKKQIHDLCDLLFWFWIPDPESDDKPVIPTACQFFRKDIIALMICNSDHEALIDLFVDNFQALSANNNVRIYRNSVNAVSLMMLRKLIRTGHLHDSILLIVLKDWLQKHRNTEDSKEQDRFIEIIREIVAEDYSAVVLMRILNDRTTLISDHPSEFQKRFGGHLWVGFHWLYLVAYSWVFERRIKTNDNLSKMYLPPEFIHGIDCSDDTLVKILDFIEYPINIKVAERDGPRAFCERMRVKIGQLDLNRASLATRLHFHPKVSQVEYP